MLMGLLHELFLIQFLKFGGTLRIKVFFKKISGDGNLEKKLRMFRSDLKRGFFARLEVTWCAYVTRKIGGLTLSILCANGTFLKNRQKSNFLARLDFLVLMGS